MITKIDEVEIERLLDTTDKLLETCKKDGSLSKAELQNIEDQTYYFRKAFEKSEFDFQRCNREDDEDDEDDYDY